MLRRAAHVVVHVALFDVRVPHSVVFVGAEGYFLAVFTVVLVLAIISAIVDVLYSNLLIVPSVNKDNAFVIANFLILFYIFLPPLVEPYILEVI